ncbi:zinc ribbon domain-containing protein [Marinithermus hydrothermalis]|uniref:zinc ribbon domain-containing protein n=1 Tax=Marinithermus hydrothermalis TaxID=186192 RepID=UPI0002DE0D01|nr:zinc ribbon domain-containing protein [Marinithermus hydrothermalis]
MRPHLLSHFVQTLTVRCTLKPTLEQAEALEATAKRFAEGCNHVLRVAKRTGTFRRFALHRLVYRDLRAMGLSANLAVQAIARVVRRKGQRAKHYQATSCDYDRPRHTSRTCSRCGHTSKASRRSQARFRCEACGFQHNADWVASVNIARRALAQGAGSAGPGHGQLALMLGHRLERLHLPAS